MKNYSIEFQRDRLSRAYQLESEYYRMRNGYMEKTEYPSRIGYLLRLFEYQFLSHYPGPYPHWRTVLRKLGGKRTLPDFFVLGAIKSGTSDLAVNLLLHPHVMIPLVKEIYTSDPEEWRIFYPTERQKSKFVSHYGYAKSPFLSPHLHSMELAYNLSKIQPNSKIVLVLRDPVARVYSQWKWELFMSNKKRTQELPFLTSFSAYVDMALDLFPECSMYTVCGFDVLRTSIYWKAVGYWIDCFGSNNVMVTNASDYFFSPKTFLNEIYEFVGLEKIDYLASNIRINENPITFPKPDDETLSKLSKFYEYHNERLWNLLGKRFDWS